MGIRNAVVSRGANGQAPPFLDGIRFFRGKRVMAGGYFRLSVPQFRAAHALDQAQDEQLSRIHPSALSLFADRSGNYLFPTHPSSED